jgi:hypothetical protein
MQIYVGISTIVGGSQTILAIFPRDFLSAWGPNEPFIALIHSRTEQAHSGPISKLLNPLPS